MSRARPVSAQAKSAQWVIYERTPRGLERYGVEASEEKARSFIHYLSRSGQRFVCFPKTLRIGKLRRRERMRRI